MPESDRASRLGLGTVQFGMPYGVSNSGGQVPLAEARAILDCAASAGVRVLDTAAAYGTAEAVLGELLPSDRRFRVVTKTLRLAEGLDNILARARRSVGCLGGAPVDTLLVHSAGDLAGATGDMLWQELLKLRAEGLFRRIGISAYATDNPVELARRFSPEVMQVPVSVVDQRLVADGSLGELRRMGVEVHVRSIFLQGLLFLAPGMLPPRLAHAAPELDRIRERIREAGATPLSAALGFALDQRDIDVVLVGVTTVSELQAILGAAGHPPVGLDWSGLALEDAVVLNPALW